VVPAGALNPNSEIAAAGEEGSAVTVTNTEPVSCVRVTSAYARNSRKSAASGALDVDLDLCLSSACAEHQAHGSWHLLLP
jgi:hypothetical protein